MIRQTVVFNGIDIAEGADVVGLTRPLAPRRVESRRVSGMDGEAFAGSALGTRTVSMTFAYRGCGRFEQQEIVRRLAAALDVHEPASLAFGDDGGLSYLAIPSGAVEPREMAGAMTVQIGFTVLDPVMYGEQRTATVPSGGSVTIDVGGTYPTRPVITAQAAKRGADNAWRITLDGGDYIQVTPPTSSATAVVVDCDGRAAAVGGAASMITLGSDWLELAPGQHVLEMTVGTGAASVAWTERWL